MPVWLIGGDAVLTVAADMPTVWLVDIDDPVTRRRAQGVALTSADLTDAARHADAARRLLRRQLVRLLLAAASGGLTDAVAIERDVAGAPIVTAPGEWRLSVAARWPRCAIGVSHIALGVDIERIDNDALPADLLTEGERAQARGRLGEGRAARCWAAKEAHAKWTGRPRQLDPEAIDTARLPIVTSRFGATRCWLRDHAGHVAAICTA